MKLDLLRTLELEVPTHAGGRRHLSAASGLVVIDGTWYVVGDDALHLAVFDQPAGVEAGAPGRLVRLFAGELPADAKQRKARKPDLETLFLAPAFRGAPHGALLAMGSGSRENRQRLAWLALDEAGTPSARVCEASLVTLYEPLHARFSDLNIEGAFVNEACLYLLQRANAGSPENAVIRYDWAGIAAWLGHGGPAPHPVSITVLDIGRIDDVPLGFTDAKPWRDGSWVFSAVAEATDDSYRDGACLGSVIGIVDRAGRVQRLERIEGDWKVEGLDVTSVPTEPLQLVLVTDADDPDRPAQALRLIWDRSGKSIANPEASA
ncbi:DUF6929 family protein [Rhizobacter sp. LjRoot28]|uniref:DUF6929 family protein n=1 Tax=Rhizobacter sp. LjRoot28 TaxID=3342309 RepID=UPI003ECCA6B2